MENLVKQGWRVIREWRNRFGNHWVLLTPEGRIWSGVDNVRNKSKAWRRLIVTVPPNKGLQSDGATGWRKMDDGSMGDFDWSDITQEPPRDRKSTRLNSSHGYIS